MEYISKSVKETHKIAKTILLDLIKSHEDMALVIILKGELGAGKTEFVKGLKEVFKIKENILSPTFVLMKVYNIVNPRFKKIYHFDLYRLKEGEMEENQIISALETLNIYDVLNDSENIVLIEWGEGISLFNKIKARNIEIKQGGDGIRKFKIDFFV